MTHGVLHPNEAGVLLDEHEDNVDNAFTAWQGALSVHFTSHADGDDEAVTGSSSRDIRLPQTSGDHEANVSAAKESLIKRGFFDGHGADAPAQQASDTFQPVEGWPWTPSPKTKLSALPETIRLTNPFSATLNASQPPNLWHLKCGLVFGQSTALAHDCQVTCGRARYMLNLWICKFCENGQRVMSIQEHTRHTGRVLRKHCGSCDSGSFVQAHMGMLDVCVVCGDYCYAWVRGCRLIAVRFDGLTQR